MRAVVETVRNPQEALGQARLQRLEAKNAGERNVGTVTIGNGAREREIEVGMALRQRMKRGDRSAVDRTGANRRRHVIVLAAVEHAQLAKTLAGRQHAEQDRRAVFQQIGETDMPGAYEKEEVGVVLLKIDEFVRRQHAIGRRLLERTTNIVCQRTEG